jgi:DNA-directed RNA polymerase subunit F
VDFTLGDHLLYPTEKSQHQLIMSTGKATLSIKQEPVYSFLEKISMLDSEDKSETEDDLLEILSSNDQSFAKRWNDFLGNDDAEQKTANNTADINDFKRESSEPEVRLVLE